MARGNITKRKRSDGSTAYRVRFDVASPDGARSQASETVDTKRDAERLLARRLEELRTGEYAAPSTLTVAEYLTQWLETLPGAGVSPSRHASCAQIVRLYIVPTLGHRRLSALTTLEIQGLVSRHVAAGLAPSTIKVIHSTFRTALGRAVAWRLVSRNPAAGVTVPRVITRPPAAWSAEQVRVFFAATADHPLHPLWRLSLDTGMRPGEAVVVRWGDLDLDRGVLTVARTMTRDARFRPVVGETTKTGAARRVTLTPETVACLRAHRSVAGTIDRAAYVFARPDGRPVASRSVGTAFARSIAATGLPAIRLHDLRHTNITLLIAAGVPVTVIAERVGHARVSMTLDTYAHVLAGMRDDAARALSALFTTPRDPDVTTDDADRSKSAPA